GPLTLGLIDSPHLRHAQNFLAKDHRLDEYLKQHDLPAKLSHELDSRRLGLGRAIREIGRVQDLHELLHWGITHPRYMPDLAAMALPRRNDGKLRSWRAACDGKVRHRCPASWKSAPHRRRSQSARH